MYAEPQVFNFATPQLGKLGLNVIVGQNNSGKSTALAILKELFQQSPDFILDSMSRVGESDPVVKLQARFGGEQETIICDRRTEGFYVKTIEGMEEAQSTARRFQLRKRVRFLPSRRSWTDRFNRTAKQSKDQMEVQLFDLPRTQEAQLGSILSSIVRDGEKAKFDAVLRRVIPDVLDWGVNRFRDEDYIEYKSPAGRYHALGLLGEGLASVFRMTYTLFSSQPNDVVILDEPELSLHPEAQKSLYLLLRELSVDRQVIIATHSPYMVNWEDLGRGARLFRVGLNKAGSARVYCLSEAAIRNVLPAVEGDLRNRKNFDVLAKEVFFRQEVLFCEGQEDVLYTENYLNTCGRPPLPMFGYGSGGDSLIRKWLVLARDLGIRAAALYDANVQTEAESVAAQFEGDENVNIWILPTGDIRDKVFNGEARRGVFSTRGEINPEFRDQFDRLINTIHYWLNA